jgi:collagenase-like PrtC family protease
VCLARELTHREIKDIGIHKNQMMIQIQVAGYAYMMHSRWKLISNFQQTQNIKENLSQTKLYLREISRQEPSIIFENDDGTHILTNYSLNLLDVLPDLYTYGVDTVRVDSFLHNANWIMATTKVYLEAIQHINNRSYVQTLVKKLPNDKYSHGFYHMNKADLVYLNQTENVYE